MGFGISGVLLVATSDVLPADTYAAPRASGRRLYGLIVDAEPVQGAYDKGPSGELVLNSWMRLGHPCTAVDHRPIALDRLSQHLGAVLPSTGLGEKLDPADVLDAVGAYNPVLQPHTMRTELARR
jgi:hypothetical protein